MAAQGPINDPWSHWIFTDSVRLTVSFDDTVAVVADISKQLRGLKGQKHKAVSKVNIYTVFSIEGTQEFTSAFKQHSVFRWTCWWSQATVQIKTLPENVD